MLKLYVGGLAGILLHDTLLQGLHVVGIPIRMTSMARARTILLLTIWTSVQDLPAHNPYPMMMIPIQTLMVSLKRSAQLRDKHLQFNLLRRLFLLLRPAAHLNKPGAEDEE